MKTKSYAYRLAVAFTIVGGLPLMPSPGWGQGLSELDRETPNQRSQTPNSPARRPQTPPAASQPQTEMRPRASVPPENSAAANGIRALLDLQPYLTIGSTRLNVPVLKKLYSLRGYRPYLVEGSGISNLGVSVQDMLANESQFHGFNGSHYFTPDTAARMEARDLNQAIEAELLLVDGYVKLAFNMASGRINPRDKSQNLEDIELAQQPPPPLESINNALKNVESMQQGIRDLAPHTLAYVKLLQTLVALKNAQSWGGWPALQDRTPLKPGMSHPNVWPVRVRLVDMGALPKSQRKNTSLIYDDEMVEGVKKLQKALFLSQDAVVGEKTYNIFAVPLESRIIQTKANLERWRLLPRDLGNRFLFVDLGRQELDIMADNKMVDRMRVVVGKDLNGTPTMIDEVRNVIVNPYWRPPRSIIVKEIIPDMLRDATYLRRNNMKVLSSRGEIDPNSVDWRQYSMENPPPYEFRQGTGEANSLGVLKFSLKNPHAIYMHDTNHKEAFNRSIRYLSHGCIRLQKPMALASYLLNDQGYDMDAIQDEINDPRSVEKAIPLTQPMKVYIFGTTMVAHASGVVAFGEDIYKQDQRIVDAMNGVHTDMPKVKAPSMILEQETVKLTPAR